MPDWLVSEFCAEACCWFWFWASPPLFPLPVDPWDPGWAEVELGADAAFSSLAVAGEACAASPGRMYLGKSSLFSAGLILSSCSVKLKSGGNSRPFGSRVFCSRSSSKKLWAQAWRGVIRSEGVYSRRRATRSIASDGVRALNTWRLKGWKLKVEYFFETIKYSLRDF